MHIVLIVDDDAVICSLLAEALEDDGYEVVTAGTGLAGISHLNESCPHLIISDYTMPGLDGIAFLNALREHSLCRNVPFILMSGLPPAGLRKLAPHCSALLKKPFRLDNAVALVSTFLRSEMI